MSSDDDICKRCGGNLTAEPDVVESLQPTVYAMRCLICGNRTYTKNGRRRMNTQDRVIQVIAENQGLEFEEVKADSTIDDLQADSLDVIEITMGIEEEFDIELSDEDVEKFETVQSVIDCVEAAI